MDDPVAAAVRLGLISPRIEATLREMMAERGEPAWVLLSEGDPPRPSVQAAIDQVRELEERAAAAADFAPAAHNRPTAPRQ